MTATAGETASMYLRNCWYVAAWAHEIESGLLARTILDEAVGLCRKRHGAPAAVADRFPHLRPPPSNGDRKRVV